MMDSAQSNGLSLHVETITMARIPLIVVLLISIGIPLSTTSWHQVAKAADAPFQETRVSAANLVEAKKNNGLDGGPHSGPESGQPVNDREVRLGSPRQTLFTLLDAAENERIDQGLDCLDLSGFDPNIPESKRLELADKTYRLLDEVFDVNYWLVPDLENHDGPFTLATAVESSSEQVIADAEKIQIVKSVDGKWRFSSATLTAIEEEIWPQWSDQIASIPAETTTFAQWIEDQFPESLQETYFLLPTYQWLCLFILIVAGFAIDICVRHILNFLTNTWFRFVKAKVDFKARRNLWKPVGLLTQSLVWYLGARLINLPPGFQNVLLVVLKLFACVAAVWTAFRAIELLKSYLLDRAARTKSKFDDLLVPFVSTTLKFVAVCGGLVLFVDIFEGPWKTIWGGLGIGGVAIAIAAKDVLGNVFGSVTVLTDRPFEIGDWVVIDKFEGTVEAVGLRSSKIRTFYNSIVVMPNSILTTAVVDNMGKRQFRRFRTMIGVQYDTSPEQIDAFCEGIRELIRNQKHTRKDYFLVHLNNFSASSVDIMLYCFFRCPDWDTELDQRHKLMLDIMRLADRLDVQFAFPTQTIHYYNEEKTEIAGNGIPQPPPEWGRSAAQQIMDDHEPKSNE